MGLGCKAFHKKPKEYIWRRYLVKKMPARAEYYVKAMPNLPLSGLGLDIGCGDGMITFGIPTRYYIHMIGLDIAVCPSPTGEFVKADATSLPFKPEAFALVTCFSSIEHIPERLRTRLYQEVHRILEPGGYLVVQLPNRFFPMEQHSYFPFIGYLPGKFHGLFFHDFVSVPSRRKLIGDMRASGFHLEMTIPLEAPYIPLLKRASRVGVFKVLPFDYLIVMKKPAISSIVKQQLKAQALGSGAEGPPSQCPSLPVDPRDQEERCETTSTAGGLARQLKGSISKVGEGSH
ncbi:MAG: class I SAM-dependent methyltransferase [Dehalococcoidia bacterium]